MAKIRLLGKRERLINGKWTIPGDVVEIPNKLVWQVVERLGVDIAIVEEAQSDRVKHADGTADGGSSTAKKRTRR
ncbi:MAG: hypothetical protein AB1453_03865 [Chloroflexota bacterium]|jgi:hypothetical protein